METARHPESKARVAVANLSFSKAWGGLEMSSVKMTRLFYQAGHQSFEICQPGTPIEKSLTENGLSARTLKVRDYLDPMASRQIRAWVRQNSIQALFLHSMRDIWLAAPALWRLPDVKLIGFARMFFKDVNKRDLLHRLMYGRLNHMIALSHIQKSYLMKCLPIPEEKFVVIPNGVDVERFKPQGRNQKIRQEWGFTDDHFVFGLIGRLDRQKGSMEFVEAAAQVVRRHKHARFVLVGGNTVGEVEFDRAVKIRLHELKLDGCVVLTEFRKDIPEVMNAIEVFCMPSYEENFANVLLEALSSGVASIGTNSGGTPEILDTEVGLLCRPQSSESLAAAMIQLLENPTLHQKLGRAARAKALSTYDMRVVFGKIQSLVSQ